MDNVASSLAQNDQEIASLILKHLCHPFLKDCYQKDNSCQKRIDPKPLSLL